ncbi:MAG: hypothetical protein ACR2J8_14240, partial [Thermomicrobiales bacterium]
MAMQQLVAEAYPRGDFGAGQYACDQLRCMDGMPVGLDEHTRRNQTFYARPLEEIAAGVTSRPIERAPGAGVPLDPPALMALGDVLLSLARSETVSGPRWHGVIEDSGGVRPSVAGDVADGLGLAPGEQLAGLSLIAGVGVAVLAGVLTPAGGGWPSVALANLDLATMTFGPALRAGEPDPGLWTGVWPGAWRDGQLVLFPALGPTATMEADLQSGMLSMGVVHDAPRLADVFHAATPLAPFGDGYLAVAREFVSYPGGAALVEEALSRFTVYREGLHTLHRFVAFDREFRITGMSHPFVFATIGDEACGGLALVGGQAFLAWNAGQAESMMTALPVREIERLLFGVMHNRLLGVFTGGPGFREDAARRPGEVAAARAHQRGRAAAVRFGSTAIE